MGSWIGDVIGGAVDGSGDTSSTDDTIDTSPTPTFPPSQPTHVTAQGISATRVVLNWDQPNDDADGFVIKRYGADGKHKFTLAGSARTFWDQTVSPGRKYQYYVIAFDAGGETESDPATASTLGNHLTVTQQPPMTLPAGQTFSLAVDLRNASGVLDTAGQSSLSVSVGGGPNGAALGGNLTVQADQGVATFSSLSLTKAGTYRLSITDGTAVVATRNVKVTADASTAHLVLQHQAADTIGKNLGLTFAVNDAFGNVVTSNSSITLSVVSGPGALQGTLTAPVRNGRATFGRASLTVAGTYTLRASDAALPGNPMTFTQVVDKAAVRFTVPGNGAVYMYGKPETITSGVVSVPAVAFSGEATLVGLDGTVLATAALTENGHMGFTTNLSAGTYTAAVHFDGDANHEAGVSRSFTFSVKAAATGTTLSASQSHVALGDPLMLSIAVASRTAGVPTGSVSVFDGVALVGTAAVDETGHATLSLSSLPVGRHVLMAVYTGDGNYKSSRSSGVRVVIDPAVAMATLI